MTLADVKEIQSKDQWVDYDMMSKAIDFLLAEVSRLETALWSKDEGLLERDKKIELATARECQDLALQFTAKGYHPEKRETATQIAACIQVRFGI